ncbi:MORN repeat-containing protein 4 homolog isoform X2 [Cylas formicarius]|uniref:MORN repeat-containing protein 4 homolog isoform X2 n=1 Tax=Cylas formicarius TaxID=197179 RepID=UPI002958D825|nr:MORN repeat-containing protein 4 homolog isoform X2 [Cylas formicarius]
MDDESLPVVVNGGYRCDNGSIYVGSWNNEGKRHGNGHLLLADGTRYDGYFQDGLYNGLGVLTFTDGAKYEGEFFQGWFHGYGIFWRSDGMRHEGEFRGGKVWGLGLTTFKDNTNGFPKNEGFFQNCQLKLRKKCPDIIQKAQKISLLARQNIDLP